ncbi:MAG: shikimate dehydrogenase [Saprospiraceae bacterium]
MHPTRQYGIIGYPLSHTFSPGYFNAKFSEEQLDAKYDVFPIESIEGFPTLIQKHIFYGINVTIPYKEQVMPYLDNIDSLAADIGAVNTIKFINGKTKGYNTDFYGFEQSLLALIKSKTNITQALILGSGGAAKAVYYVLQSLQIPYLTVGRHKNTDLMYEEVDASIMKSSNLIINTTPLGMYPKENYSPQIPYQYLNSKYFLYDLVYNPEKTLFLSEGTARGCKVKNGFDMLILQAEKSWQIWNQPEH